MNSKDSLNLNNNTKIRKSSRDTVRSKDSDKSKTIKGKISNESKNCKKD